MQRFPRSVVMTTFDRFKRIDALLNIACAVPQINLFEMTDDITYQTGFTDN
jgi:3-oxoacyl-[acyl-carrier protein] reductase